MGWSHILIEGHCFYNKEENKLPKCCKYGPQKISINCLNFNLDKRQYCSFLGFNSARSTKVLTDEQGVVIDFDMFHTVDLSEKEYLELENEWIKKSKFP